MEENDGKGTRGEAFGAGTQRIHAKAFGKADRDEETRERAQRAALWAQFACAALPVAKVPPNANGERKTLEAYAGDIADAMLAEYDERFGGGAK